MYVVGIKSAKIGKCPHGHKHKRKEVVLALADVRMGGTTIEDWLCPTCLGNLVENMVHHPLGRIVTELAQQTA